ncbi:MAG: xanthine dehydrogenase family protein, partial [Pseudomonadota bacterium]
MSPVLPTQLKREISSDPNSRAVGAPSLDRRSDRLVRGEAQFTADVHLHGALHMAFARSPVADANIDGLDVEAARKAHGVVDVAIGDDVDQLGLLALNEIIPVRERPPWPVLATSHVDAVGQPVAAIIADTPLLAADAAELIEMELADRKTVSNVVAEKSWTLGEVEAAFASAAHHIHCDVDHARLAPSPMETRAISVRYNT